MGTCLGCGASWTGFGAYCNMCKVSGLIEAGNKIASGQNPIDWSDKDKIATLKIYGIIILSAVLLIVLFPDWGISRFFKFIFRMIWAVFYAVTTVTFDIFVGFLRMIF